MDGAKEYDKLLAMKTKKNPERYEGKTWMDDRAERDRRCWEWWRVKSSKFNFFFIAARHVALVPISSASAGRTFSEVKFIVESVGENVLEETLETRLMERKNRY